MTDRAYDIALFGATGFTGSLTAHWLVERGARFCIAGRNRAKLERVQSELGEDVPIEICNTNDPASLRALAAKSRVILTTVGPYARYGMPVVEAAVAEGCDYVDITGEPDFVSDSRDRFDAAAREKKLRIVHCCGFDSLPHDLGAWFTVKQLPDDADLEVAGYVSSRGGISGGTWASAIEGMSQMPLFGGKKKPSRPSTESGYRARIRQKFHRSRRAGGWAVPMPTIDPVIVVRSARALHYGKSFSYGHYARVKTKRYLIGGALAVGGVFLASRVPGLNTWLKAQWPSGSGPDQEQREKGWFKARFIGKGGGKEVVTEIRGDGDPGYHLTSRWVAECALSLVEDRDELPDRFGVLTPVAALEQAIAARMPATDTHLEVVEVG